MQAKNLAYGCILFALIVGMVAPTVAANHGAKYVRTSEDGAALVCGFIIAGHIGDRTTERVQDTFNCVYDSAQDLGGDSLEELACVVDPDRCD